jgi:hypothetical protein
VQVSGGGPNIYDVELFGADPRGFLLPQPDGIQQVNVAGPFPVNSTESLSISLAVPVTPGNVYDVTLEYRCEAFGNPSPVAELRVRGQVDDGTNFALQGVDDAQTAIPRQVIAFDRHVSLFWTVRFSPQFTPLTVGVLGAIDLPGTVDLISQNLIVEVRNV